MESYLLCHNDSHTNTIWSHILTAKGRQREREGEGQEREREREGMEEGGKE